MRKLILSGILALLTTAAFGIQLEVGKKYVPRNAPEIQYVEIVSVTSQITYSYMGNVKDLDGTTYLLSFTEQGCFFEHCHSDQTKKNRLDLVAEYKEPTKDCYCQCCHKEELHLQVGHKYRDRKGNTVEIVYNYKRGSFPFLGVINNDSRELYTEYGRFLGYQENSGYLVEDLGEF